MQNIQLSILHKLPQSKYKNLKRYIKNNKVEEKENIDESNLHCKETLQKLHIIQPNDPDLTTFWKETFKQRQKDISIENYYEEYPILKTSIGAILIDFEIKTGIDAHIFPKKWSEIAPFILDFAVNKDLCPSLCDLRNDMISVETLSFLILPYIFQPCNVKTGNKRKWKPSKVEVAESFICRIPLTELEPKSQKRKEKLQAFGLTLQSMIVAIGTILNLTDFYIIINNVKYVSTTLMRAVNLCFQAFFALDAKYPVDSEIMWYFLHQVYGITDEEHIRNFISVNVVWQYIQELMSALQSALEEQLK
ncbi:hypothetical protein ALC57_06167 [Trachymyrmex cornetzi]|uniref:Uncharacterized protein n=1 Tax=Trachymyrmex cornetzi TaxID=471704 RepID=A0A151J8Z1_9HYME|nr:hypothetical protein ALC57_06167 [Trachymyrmex cornetzi]